MTVEDAKSVISCGYIYLNTAGNLDFAGGWSFKNSQVNKEELEVVEGNEEC
jgi:hypothetical protein